MVSTRSNLPESVYRIFPRDSWQASKRRNQLEPSPIDQKDGFFHLSCREDVCETADLYYAGRDLVVVEWPVQILGPGLRFEAVETRGNRLFPHLYGDLPLPKDATQEIALQWNGSAFVWPEGGAPPSPKGCSSS